METKARRALSALKKELLQHPQEFTFAQAVKLLLSLSGSVGPEASREYLETNIRFRPKLALDFPPTDIDAIEEIDRDTGKVEITATFLGLYGTSSPLPAFYTEELFKDASEDITITRDFLDIFHSAIYRLFFQAVTRYHIAYKVVEEGESIILDRLYALLGYATPEMRKALPSSSPMLRHSGIFTHYPRSAASLRCTIADITGIDEVDIEQCIESEAIIPDDQRCILGKQANQLGIDTHTGSRIRERSGAFRIIIGPVDAQTFRQLLPGTAIGSLLRQHVELSLDQPLRWDVDILLHPEDFSETMLGATSWNALGRDAFLGIPKQSIEPQKVRFYPHQFNSMAG